MSQLHEEPRNPIDPRTLSPKPRTWFGRLWNELGFHTREQQRVINQALDAELHETRLRRIERNGGLDPFDPDDYMQIQINQFRAEEQAKIRAKTIRALAREILAAQVPSHSRHELHSPRDAHDAIEQATRIYDLTYAARVEPVKTNKPES